MGAKLITSDARIGETGFCFYVADKAEAIALVRSEFNDLAKIAYTGNFLSTKVYYPLCPRPAEIYSTEYQEPTLMPQSILYDNCEIPQELQRHIFAMAESDTPQGLVRLADNKQILLTANNRVVSPNCDSLVGASRVQYWNADDLASFERDWRRSLSDDGSNWFEYNYSTHDLDKPGVNVQRKHNRYKLVLDARGNPYHICESLN
jgi:hypothetical protein